MEKKFYIGDSVYVETDGYGITLTTNNGYPDDPRNKIYMEPREIHTMLNVLRLWDIIESEEEEDKCPF